MSFGHPSWITAHLLAGDTRASRVISVRSETQMFGSTSWPFGGLAGSAMTTFQMTVLTLDDSTLLIYADETFLGWVAPVEASAFLAEDWPHVLRGSTARLQPPTPCPIH